MLELCQQSVFPSHLFSLLNFHLSSRTFNSSCVVFLSVKYKFIVAAMTEIIKKKKKTRKRG